MSGTDALDLAFIGTGNAFAPQRCWSGFLLNERHLFDAPPTALYSLKCLGASLAGIETVFISHFHADHFFGLPFLFLEYAYETARTEPLTLVGPPGIEQRVYDLVELAYPSLHRLPQRFTLRFVEVEDGASGELNGLRYEAVEVEHGGELMQCYGFRVASGRRTLAYTGDTSLCSQLERLAKHADVLVTDCTYAGGYNNPEHMSLDEVKALRDTIGGDTQIILTHLGAGVEAGGCARITAAVDQARYHL